MSYCTDGQPERIIRIHGSHEVHGDNIMSEDSRQEIGEEGHDDDGDNDVNQDRRKRPRTEAQIQALAIARERACEVRRENALIREKERAIERAEKVEMDNKRRQTIHERYIQIAAKNDEELKDVSDDDDLGTTNLDLEPVHTKKGGPDNLYCVQWVNIVDGKVVPTPYYKIGRGKDGRETQVHGQNPVKFPIVNVWIRLGVLETLIHNELNEYRMNMGGGVEWFNLSHVDDVTSFIENMFSTLTRQVSEGAEYDTV